MIRAERTRRPSEKLLRLISWVTSNKFSFCQLWLYKEHSKWCFYSPNTFKNQLEFEPLHNHVCEYFSVFLIWFLWILYFFLRITIRFPFTDSKKFALLIFGNFRGNFCLNSPRPSLSIYRTWLWLNYRWNDSTRNRKEVSSRISWDCSDFLNFNWNENLFPFTFMFLFLLHVLWPCAPGLIFNKKHSISTSQELNPH